MPFVRALTQHLRAVSRRNGRRRGVRRYHENAGELARMGQCRQHVLEHRQRQFLSPRRTEEASEAPLGVARLLDRNDGVEAALHIHALTLAKASALARTHRANVSRSASVVMSVCAGVTGMPSFSASDASTRSST